MADGHFYERGAIKLHLSEKDRAHIEKFRRFVKYSGKAKSCTMNAMNPPVVHKIMEKFDITHLKTYEPCDLSWIENGDLLFSLIVGMLDGDGNVRLRGDSVSTMEMKLHKNWISNLQFIESFLYSYLRVERSKNVNLARLRKDGYSVIILSNRGLLSSMRQKALELGLPMMGRKWDRIDITYISPYQAYKARLPRVLKLIGEGIPYEKIGKMLNISEQVVAMTVYREKKKQIKSNINEN